MMEEFALCIEYLLLTQDHVLIPGLGAFRVQHSQARYDAQEETFLPPISTVLFEAQLHEALGNQFAQALQQIYRISPEQAQQRQSLWVSDFFQQLDDCGSLDLGCIGSFTLGPGEALRFTPSQSGIAAPAFYALEAFHIKPLDAQSTARAQREPSAPILEGTRDSIIIRLNRRMLKYAAAACAAIALTLSFTQPAANALLSAPQPQQSQLFLPALSSPQAAPEAVEAEAEAEVEEAVEEAAAQPAAVEAAAPEAPAAVAAQPAEQPAAAQWCIVMASAIPASRAQQYAQTLQSRGMQTARVLEGKIVRVVVGHFPSIEDARAEAQRLHTLNAEYQGAWVFQEN